MAWSSQVFLNCAQQCLFLPVAEIAAISADANYTIVTDVRRQQHMVRQTMSRWQARLPPGAFVALDRSLIVNLRNVRHWEHVDRETDVSLEGVDEPVHLGRTASSRFRDLMERKQ